MAKDIFKFKWFPHHETTNDRYWLENFHPSIILIGAELERQAYKYMTKKNTLELGDKIRKGTMFRTPLSQTSCSDTKAKTDMIHRLQEYIETRFDDENYEDLSEGEKPSTYLVPSLCEGQKLALEWDRLFRYPKIPLCFVRPYFSDSYDDIRSSLRGKDVEEKFCEQLSDQLVFCEECGQRPILFNVIRDEDSMKRHFGGDKRENEVLVKKVEEMRKTLLWKLGGPEFQPYKKDTNRKRTEPE